MEVIIAQLLFFYICSDNFYMTEASDFFRYILFHINSPKDKKCINCAIIKLFTPVNKVISS